MFESFDSQHSGVGRRPERTMESRSSADSGPLLPLRSRSTRFDDASLDASGAAGELFSFRDHGLDVGGGSAVESRTSTWQRIAGPLGESEGDMRQDDGALSSLLAGSRKEELDSGAAEGKLQMCADLLETGMCPRGADCRYAHHPSELGR